MGRGAWAVVVVLSILVGSGSVIAAATTTRDQTAEQTHAQALHAIRPSLAEAFRAATAALDEARWSEAERGFRAVLSDVPTHGPSLWRLSTALRMQNRRTDAVAAARQALTVAPGWQAQLSLAEALFSGAPLSEQDANEAKDLLAKAAIERPIEANVMKAQLAMLTNDVVELGNAVKRLQEVSAGEPYTHMLAAVHLLRMGRGDEAGAEIDRAEALGFPTQLANGLREEAGINKARAVWRMAKLSGVILVCWILFLGVIYAVGRTLSARTLHAIEAFDGRAPDVLRARTSRLRRIYKTTISLATAYYFLSIPILVIVTVLGTAGVLYGFAMLRHVPVYLLIAVFVGAFASVSSLLKSLFHRRLPDPVPGRALEEAEAPRVWALLREVAAHVGTRPVDRVYLTPDTQVSVTETGPLRKRLRDHGQRSLTLGLGVLPGFTQQQLRAILAHEYGHFSNRDTVGGGLAMAVLVSLTRALIGIAEGGGASPFNPAWLFLRGFLRLFLRVTLGASRLQEIMADLFAAESYGGESFASGLRHVVRREVEFVAGVDRLVTQASAAKGLIANIYAPPSAADAKTEADVDTATKGLLESAGSPYDSHPPPAKRIAWMSRVPATASAPADADAPAWDLFDNRAELEKHMTDITNERLVREGTLEESVPAFRPEAAEERLESPSFTLPPA